MRQNLHALRLDLAPPGAGEHPVQRRRERLLVLGTVGPRPAGHGARASEAVHEVTDREPLPHVLLRVLLAARVEDRDLLLHQARGERDVGGDGDVARLRVLRDVLVGHVRAAPYEHRRDKGVVERLRQPLVGDQHDRQLQAPRGPGDDLLDVAGGGVRVDPELHGRDDSTGELATVPRGGRPQLFSRRNHVSTDPSPVDPRGADPTDPRSGRSPGRPPDRRHLLRPLGVHELVLRARLPHHDRVRPGQQQLLLRQLRLLESDPGLPAPP